MDTGARAIQILMVEDNPGDVRLTREALKGAKVWNEVQVVEDGVAALDYLYRRPPYEAATRPDLILLDLNLPRLDGREVLSRIKDDPTLKLIPVVVLTTSQAEEDVLRAYDQLLCHQAGRPAPVQPNRAGHRAVLAERRHLASRLSPALRLTNQGPHHEC
jgi:chemotaxis family two-component system response regulator Rcp1